MRRLFVACLLAVAGAVLIPQSPKAAAEGQCGLPDTKPLWLDYTDGSVPFSEELFGKPGIIAATGGANMAPQLRQLGAQTVYWEMKLGLRVGTTAAPASPDKIVPTADALFNLAVTRSGCDTPLIALNELNGAGTATPWSVTNAQYRANVLVLLQELAARGARPFLLINSDPYTGGDAADWWRQVAQVADIVVEVYPTAPSIYKLGPVLGSRVLRARYRQAMLNFTAIGVPVTRLGLMLGFQSGPGTGGRERLQPSSAWLEVVKLYTLAARQIASDLKIATVWSWGWATFNTAGADPDKRAAACVYLWARDQSLCESPSLAGDGFDDSLTEGQINLPHGVHCTLGMQKIYTPNIDSLAAITGDRELAFTLLFERLVESQSVKVDPAKVAAAESGLVSARFGGNRAAYLASLAKAHATTLAARAVIADEMRRALIEKRLTVPAPSEAQIEQFYAAYPDLPARFVRATPAPLWLGGRSPGIALSNAAPPELFTLPGGADATVVTASGSSQVRALGQMLPLGAFPLATARPAISAALTAFAKADAFEAWAIQRETAALNQTVCRGDHLPSVGAVDLTSYLPFLSLDA
jgi:hypothetical protein